MLCKLIGDSLIAARLLLVFSLALSANEILFAVSTLSPSVVSLVLEVALMSVSLSSVILYLCPADFDSMYKLQSL